MTIEEMESAFAKRLPVMAKVNGIEAEECVISFSCIHAIRRRWDEKGHREIKELELLDRSRHSIVVAPIEDVFLQKEERQEESEPTSFLQSRQRLFQQKVEEGFMECVKAYEKYIGLVTPAVSDGFEFYLTEGMEAGLIIRIIEYACEQRKRSWQYIDTVLRGNLNDGIDTLAGYKRERGTRS